jgi:hypothetical protein
MLALGFFGGFSGGVLFGALLLLVVEIFALVLFEVDIGNKLISLRG